MPATKNQGTRLEVLDELLNTKQWTLKELLNRVNERIGGDGNTVDKRTLFRDINDLIEKGAPVHRPQKKDNLYYYTEPFSLKNLPLDEDDIASLKNAITLLNQVDTFQLSREVEEVVRKLENRIHLNAGEQVIIVQFEKHTSSTGTEHIGELLEAIKNKTVLKLSYQPFSHPKPSEKIVHPYLLKEFRNRWFLLGREGDAGRISIYALDRIKKLRPSNARYIENNLFDPTEYFKRLIGVSLDERAKPEVIEIKVYKQTVPYVLSKPIHFNQEKIKEFKDGTILIRLNLIVNYELKSILLSYGDGIEVKKPRSLREELRKLITRMNEFYA